MATKDWRFKPMKAAEFPFSELKFPCWATPKIDGINGLNYQGKSVGRSLKPYANEWLNALIEENLPVGLCYEVSVGELPYGEDLCRNTTSFVNAIKKVDARVIISVFDYVGDASEEFISSTNYLERIEQAIEEINSNHPESFWFDYDVGSYGESVDTGICMPINDFFEVRVMEPIEINSVEEAEKYYENCLDAGYEGAIYRQDIPYKCGRATSKSQEVVRAKPSHDSEAIIIGFEEAMENLNEAKVNELGHTERSSHKENLAPLGMLGSFICIDVKSGDTIKVGAGKLKHPERVAIWNDQILYKNLILKYRSMSTGVKDKPRHPRWIDWRDINDLSEEDAEKAQEILDGISKNP